MKFKQWPPQAFRISGLSDCLPTTVTFLFAHEANAKQKTLGSAFLGPSRRDTTLIYVYIQEHNPVGSVAVKEPLSEHHPRLSLDSPNDHGVLLLLVRVLSGMRCFIWLIDVVVRSCGLYIACW